MSEPILSPREAEEFVERRIERYGLGALPKVHVLELPNERWRVLWLDHERVVSPMSRPEWAAWIEQHVGEVTDEKLVTTEG